MPRRSRVLGPIDVPAEYLAPLVRGLSDGDGSVTNAVWRADTSRRSDYYWECFRAKFVSGSRPHPVWLHTQLRTALGLRGWIALEGEEPQGVYVLGFGKSDSTRPLSWLYPDRDAPCLLRKRAIWDDYVRRHPLSKSA